jgi:hypothetical protein
VEREKKKSCRRDDSSKSSESRTLAVLSRKTMKRYESVSWIYASNARRPACTEEKEWMRGERKKEVVCGWGGGPEGAGGRHSLVSVRYNSSTGIDTQLQQLLLDPSADTARSDPDDRGRRDSIVRTAREWNIITNHSPISLSHSSGLLSFNSCVGHCDEAKNSWHYSTRICALVLPSIMVQLSPPFENGNSPSNCYSISPIQ